MTKKTRDFIFYLSIFIFVAGTVIISLLASGYKFNLSWPLKSNRLLIKTGMIAVDTVPRGAVVYLNDVPQANFSLNPFKKEYLTTAAKIKNVMPGEYDLRLEREGYWPFQKKINVYSGQTTFAEDINLFRNDKPLLLSSCAETEISLSTSRKYLYVPAEKKIMTLKTGASRTIAASNQAAWLNSSDRLFSAGDIYGAEASSDAAYSSLLGKDADSWYLDEDQERLYYRSGNMLGYLKMNNRTSVVAFSGQTIDTYEPRGDSIFLVSSASGKSSLKKYSISDQKSDQEISLPSVGKYEFHHENRPSLVLFDSLNKTLYIINPDNIQTGAKAIKNVIDWQWVDDNTLLYSNNWEIYRFNLKSGNSDLLTRVGEEITGLVWNGEKEYLIFSTADSLNALDMKMNAATKIYQADKISGPVLDEKNGLLYFWAKQGQEAGAYEIILQ